MINDFQNVIFQSILGMDKDEFMRKANLMRNPEGWDEEKRCPVCKKPIIIDKETGDMFCSNYSIGYKTENKCYWHRYSDGLNYWSTPEEMVQSMCSKDPEFKKKFEDMFSKM